MSLPVFRIDSADMSAEPGATLTLNGAEGRHAVTVTPPSGGEVDDR